VVLPGAVRERARVGARPDHGELDAARLPAGGCCAGARPGTWWCIARRRGAAGRCGTGRGTSLGWRI